MMPIPAIPPESQPGPPAIHVTVTVRPIDFMRLALCIEEKEQGSWNKDGGKACWTRLAWFETCSLSFSYAQSPSASRANQVLRLSWIAERLHSKQVNITVYRLAMVWNKGFDRAVADWFHPAQSELAYANAVRALYLDADFKPDPLIP